jgi:hypothetical protein
MAVSDRLALALSGSVVDPALTHAGSAFGVIFTFNVEHAPHVVVVEHKGNLISRNCSTESMSNTLSDFH